MIVVLAYILGSLITAIAAYFWRAPSVEEQGRAFPVMIGWCLGMLLILFLASGCCYGDPAGDFLDALYEVNRD